MVKPINRIVKFIPWALLLIILGIGAYLRLHDISLYMTFLGDEGRDVLVVKRMIVDGKWTLLGPTASVGGFFMGPIYYYFMVPFLWLFQFDPVGPAIMVALFGIATIYLVFFVGWKWFSKSVGLIAASLYAVSPLIIAYSRSSWNPNIVPFFSLLSMYLLWKYKEEQKMWSLFFAGICIGIGLQLHYTFLFLCLGIGIWMILERNYRKHIKAYIMLFLGFLIGFSPFLAFEVRHAFSNSRNILSFIFTGKDTGLVFGEFWPHIKDVYGRLFGRLLLRIPESGTLGNLPKVEKTLWTLAQLILSVTSGIAVGIFALKKNIITKVFPENKNVNRFSDAIKLLIIWLVVPLFCFGIYRKNIYDYYFGIFYAVPFLMTALAIYALWSWKIIGKIIAVVVFISLLIFNWEGRPFKFEPNNQRGQVKLIAEEVLSKTDGKPYNFALISGGNSDHAYRYFLELWGKSPVTIENFQIDPERTSVTDQLIIVCEDIFCQPLGDSLWEVAGFGRAEIEGVWDVSVVKIFKLRHYKENS